MDPREHVTQFNHGNSPEDIFNEFKARRGAMLKALTTNVERFFQECDPEKKELSLYGNIDGNWQVTVRPEYVPPNLPEPVVGINFVRDSMERKEWLELVAIHSDSWLLSVSLFYANYYCRFDVRSRRKLFSLINSLPTLHDIVCPTENSTRKVNKADRKTSNPTKVSQVPPLAQRKEEDIEGMDKKERVKEEEESKVPSPTQRKEESINDMDKMEGVKQEEESEEEKECGHCGKSNNDIGMFWILCGTCQRWFHGKCADTAREKEKSLNNYHCPECLAKRGREIDLNKDINAWI